MTRVLTPTNLHPETDAATRERLADWHAACARNLTDQRDSQLAVAQDDAEIAGIRDAFGEDITNHALTAILLLEPRRAP